MRKERTRFWTLALGILAGGVAGSVAGIALGDVVPVLREGVSIGTNSPVTVDLQVLKFTVGIMFQFNLASAAGILVALFFLFRR